MTNNQRTRHRLAATALLVAAAAGSAQAADTARPDAAASAAPLGAPIASHRGYRATHLFDAAVHDRGGRAIGAVDDLVVDMCNGEVRRAVLKLGAGLQPGATRRVAVPLASLHGSVVSEVESPESTLVLDLDERALAGLPAASSARDAATTQPTCTHDLSARALVGRKVYGKNGQDIGKLADLVVNMNRERVHFAVLQFDPAPSPPQRLLAFPLQLFRLEGSGRLVFPVSASYLRTLPGFVATGWSHLLSPDELADVDRQFFADFPAVWDQSPRTLFEHLDRDQSGALTRDEASRNARAQAHFTAIDRDRDQQLSKLEFVSHFPRATPQ